MGTKVLVVDDSITVRQQVTFALAQAGFAVVQAEDGADGIRKLTANPDVAMVICDVNMPRMNGIEMIEAVNQGPRKGLIIIMLTTMGQSTLVKRAAQAGAKAWLVKPFKKEHLIAAISKLMGTQ